MVVLLRAHQEEALMDWWQGLSLRRRAFEAHMGGHLLFHSRIPTVAYGQVAQRTARRLVVRFELREVNGRLLKLFRTSFLFRVR